ncbi:MAG TPA: phosphoglucomutase [Clostridiales bacterium]|nr:phosphoglucomutase [Clostridiales bacterium]
MEYIERYREWREFAGGNRELMAELDRIADDEKQIEDRFYKNLSFGTGGLRGLIGAGDNRMNVFTVKKASQGLAYYLMQESAHPSVAVAFDSRRNSEVFADAAAEVFAANGIHVRMFGSLAPTPMLSFAVRELSCSAGIVITASHNPAEYNGYKVYGDDGCQITLPAAEKITGFIDGVDIFSGVRSIHCNDALLRGVLEYIGEPVIEKYFEEVRRQSVFSKTAEADLAVAYSPLCGTGQKPVKRILSEIGVSRLHVVKEQEMPDPDFTTCPYPNPEEKDALTLALALMQSENADLLLATDPDCDRVGVAARRGAEPVLLTGNQIGVLLFDFICAMRRKNGTMPQNPVAVKTIVTTEMAQSVADEYGVELRNVLTGFKFIGEQIGLLEQEGGQDRYIFGFEESYGYLSGTYARDKDAVNASMLICEMAAYYKREGKTLLDVMASLYKKHGYYFDRLESTGYTGPGGMRQMTGIMDALRKNPPEMVGGMEISCVCDYLTQTKTCGGKSEPLTLPASDVIGLHLVGGSSVVVRPSGTEPKLKVYYSLKCADEAQAGEVFARIQADVQKVLA